MTNTSVNMSNARSERQTAKMAECLDRGICPFCEPHLSHYHDAPIEKLPDLGWYFTLNDDPYEGTKVHYLLILRRHIEDVSELKPFEMEDFFTIVKYLCERDGLTHESIFMRSGDVRFTGASLTHLHGHLIVGDGSMKVKVKLATPET